MTAHRKQIVTQEYFCDSCLKETISVFEWFSVRLPDPDVLDFCSIECLKEWAKDAKDE